VAQRRTGLSRRSPAAAGEGGKGVAFRAVDLSDDDTDKSLYRVESTWHPGWRIRWRWKRSPGRRGASRTLFTYHFSPFTRSSSSCYSRNAHV